jgi:hypothetical protein
VAEVRSLLGTFGFWRQYIRHYADITESLTALTRKYTPWVWGEREQSALDALKRSVLDAPVLKRADPEKEFFVVTDASDYAIGASLEQCDADGNRRPGLFFSHSLCSAERRYPVHERELLAIVLALRTWRQYLLGSSFSVIFQTDHKPLQHFLTQTNLSPRQVRWQTFLSEYNLKVAYVPGDANNFADGLSRRPDLKLMLIGAVAPYDPWLSRITKAAQSDAETQRLRKRAMQRSSTATKALADTERYELHQGVLFFRAKGLLRVFVPNAAGLRKHLVSEFHDLPIAGHFGWKKTYDAIAQHYYWPNMTADIHQYVTHCPVCQRVKPTKQPNHLYDHYPSLIGHSSKLPLIG